MGLGRCLPMSRVHDGERDAVYNTYSVSYDGS
jgi:hypothetical protein